jgi:hypothetical protein
MRLCGLKSVTIVYKQFLASITMWDYFGVFGIVYENIYENI